MKVLSNASHPSISPCRFIKTDSYKNMFQKVLMIAAVFFAFFSVASSGKIYTVERGEIPPARFCSYPQLHFNSFPNGPPRSYLYADRWIYPGIITDLNGADGYIVEDPDLQKFHNPLSKIVGKTRDKYKETPILQMQRKYQLHPKGLVFFSPIFKVDKDPMIALAILGMNPEDRENYQSADRYLSEKEIEETATDEEICELIKMAHAKLYPQNPEYRNIPLLITRDIRNDEKQDLNTILKILEERIDAAGMKKLKSKYLRIFKEKIFPKLSLREYRFSNLEKRILKFLAGFTPEPEKVKKLMLGLARELRNGWTMMHRCTDFDIKRFAARAHQRIVDIHPFPDGNGRLARLIMNWILKKGGYPAVVFDSQEEYSHTVIQGIEKSFSCFYNYIRKQLEWTYNTLIKGPCLKDLSC